MASSDRPTVSRRRFLRQTVRATAAGIGLSIAHPFVETAPSMPTSSGQHVLVLGAGLAGLAAAWELESAGAEVTVLEARSRPGGRVHTLRQSFADDLYAEAGAVAFSEAYTQANRFVDELGLERAEWATPDLNPLYHLRGRRFAAGPDRRPDWPYDLTDSERQLGPFGLMKRFIIDPLPSEIANPDRWDEAPLVGLDDLSVAEFMRRQGASEGAIELIADTQFFGPRVDNISMLSSALAEFGLFYAGAPFVLQGGNDRLPTAMAERLSRAIHYGVEVGAVRQAEAGVEVEARRGDRTERFQADRVVCTIPAPVLRGMRFTPSLPSAKRVALQNMPYVDTTTTYVQVGRAFWYAEGVTGSASTDLPIDQVSRAPVSDAGGPQERLILKSAVRGPAATRLGVLAEEEVLEHALRHMDKVHPGIYDVQEGGIVRSWGQDPYALGCVSWPGPGDVTWYLTSLQRPHGRVHFAGEHTSVLRSTMEGALRSGIRAAAEITQTS